jgi:hypothetical protein
MGYAYSSLISRIFVNVGRILHAVRETNYNGDFDLVWIGPM